jgi:hypothetical protein
VTAEGEYNPWDRAASHNRRFDAIKQHYVVGDRRESEFLTTANINRLAPSFLDCLNALFDTEGSSVFDVIRRGGRRLDERRCVVCCAGGADRARYAARMTSSPRASERPPRSCMAVWKDWLLPSKRVRRASG